MSAPHTSTAVLQFHHRESFERNVGRALFAGAAAGGVHFALASMGFALPLPYAVLAATGAAFARGNRGDRFLLWVLALTLPAVAWLLGVSAGWAAALGGAGTGLVMVRAAQCERGEEGQLGLSRPGALNYALAAASTAGLAVLGMEVVNVLAIRLASISTPAAL
ncbi:MAG TPA: hypothetical protein VE549_02940, partial [Myxococcaceae bacterium]|nr:hypothetical protein [Myxococcaceae bacterium]